MAVRKRVLLIMTLAAGFTVTVALAVAACVPQGGKGVVVNNEAPADPDDVTGDERRVGTMTDEVVADGDGSTSHFNSWCTQPTSAVYVLEGADDELHFDIASALAGQDSNTDGCPDNDSQVQRWDGSQYTTTAAGDAYVSVNQNGNGDAYDWDVDPITHPDGIWDLSAGDESGCYASGADPKNQGTIKIDEGGHSVAGSDTETMSNLTTANSDPATPRAANSVGENAAVLCVGPDPTNPPDNVQALFFPMVVMDAGGNTATV